MSAASDSIPAPLSSPMAGLGAQAAADLEWSALLEVIADRCAGELAGQRMRALSPASTLAEARQLVHCTTAALDALQLGFPIPAQPIAEVDEVLGHIERGGAASGEQLHELTRILAAAKELRSYATARLQDVPALAELLATDPALDPVLTAIKKAIDASGHVMDEASTALARARRQIHSTRASLLDKLKQLSSKHGDVLREGSYVERDGRYGLPVRADAHRRVEGIVLGSSSTGATVYVEPPAVTQLGNQLRIAEGDVEREVARVLATLSERVRGHIDSLRVAYEVALHADHLSALCRWAQHTKSRALPIDDEPVLALEHMRHPLLVAQGAPVVANDLTLRAGQALVISGPNAGGKTVALKSFGLAACMARAGIPIPCGEGSRIGWLGRVLTDVGDNQSIAQSLSTFSAHVASLSRMLQAADGTTLVILDEIAGGTDPEEGSALAAAVLEGLVARGAAVVTTTHYERLKELAAQDDRFVNASVGFDFEAMEPTFMLTVGVPGASSALAVAQRFGMPAETLGRARAHLSLAAIDREKLLADLHREQNAANLARQAAETDALAVATLRAELAEQRTIVREKERKKLEREKAALMADIRGARAKLRDLDEVIEKGGKSKAQRRVDEAASVVALGSAVDEATKTRHRAPSIDTSRLAIGDRVFVRSLGAEAEVVEGVKDDGVKVRAGVFTLRVPLHELGAAKPKKRSAPPPKPPKKRKRRPESEEETRRTPMRTSTNTCDLRGKRVDEALEDVDRFVDSFLSGGVDEAGFVLHGHGTGALKKAVRDHLALHGRIAEQRPASQQEGGDAFTVFWVRD
jgi:DNA mismatch repair protein MutS2